ncbi:MAG: histidine phosphatase family protein, partial [Actinobacteria bacterium]|nr:histidine phosphatase family protein [Actinomycetota bacterium]
MSDNEGGERIRQIRFTRPPGACELLLVRHGESEAADPNEPFPTVDGHGDPALHADGRVQAERVAERLADEPIDAIYVTSL